MANIQLSAVDIEKLWYADYTVFRTNTSLSGTDVYDLLNSGDIVEIMNVHQDTWSIEETEASQEKYKNQLTGNVYRMGAKEMGEINVQFTIGRYDYALKKALLGGVCLYDGFSTVMYSNNATSGTTFYRTYAAAKEAGVASPVLVTTIPGTVYASDKNAEVFYKATGTGHTESFAPSSDKGNAVGWARARGIVELKRVLIARTEDKQYVVLPQANVNTREANTDKAIGLAVTATAMEPDNEALMSEYWFDESEVKSKS